MMPGAITQVRSLLEQRDNLIRGAETLGKAALIAAGWKMTGEEGYDSRGRWKHDEHTSGIVGTVEFNRAIEIMKERQLS